MDVIDLVVRNVPFKMCVLCRRLLTLSVLHDCYNKKNHQSVHVETFTQITKVLFY